MGDVLSQNEIDNLLSALNSGEFDPDEAGETDDRQIKDYDFARPSKFSKEHLRTLEFIFEHYARLLSTNLPVYLRKNVQVEVMHSEAVTYQEFSNSLSNPVILGVVNFAPLDGNIIMEVSTEIGFAIVDRMLGGGGKPLEKNREFTEIELTIIERIMVVCTNLLVEPCLGAKMVQEAAGSAFAVREAKNIQFRNVRIKSEKAMLKHVIDAEEVDGLKIADCELQTGVLSGDSLRCVNVRGLQIENTVFPERRNDREQIRNEKHNETRRIRI